MYRQPKYHPDSTVTQIVLCNLRLFLAASTTIVLPFRWTAGNRFAATALAKYQSHCFDYQLLAAEIADRNPRSPIFRLVAAEKMEQAAIDDDERRQDELRKYSRLVVVYWARRLMIIGAFMFVTDQHSLLAIIGRWIGIRF